VWGEENEGKKESGAGAKGFSTSQVFADGRNRNENWQTKAPKANETKTLGLKIRRAEEQKEGCG